VSRIADKLLMMGCDTCEYMSTTPADNKAVACGNYVCPRCDKRMHIEAVYEKIEEPERDSE